MGNTIQDKLIPVITEVGRQASFNADVQGLKVNIKYIAIGSGRYEPNKTMTALQDEKLRVPIQSSEIDKTNYQITLNSIFKDEEKEFWITEIGFFLEDGTLFAIWSDKTKALSYKSIFSKPIFAFTLKLVDVNIDSINIVDNGLDLKLNYLNEFLLTTGAITKLSLTMMKFHEKLKKSIFDFGKELAETKENLVKSILALRSTYLAREKEIDIYHLEFLNVSMRDKLHRLKKFYADKERRIESVNIANEMFVKLREEIQIGNSKQDKNSNDNLLLSMTNMNAILKINEREIK
jgi:hypothetical protein